ncbi:hypothetical protein [Levilactobacillus enshiensis]|uniref:hypothetical protein n=1 Tax=Levilactobacillus enshiensis TaxID=2590213 RepID=UPI001CDC95DA|nr:hypothetical protein [Levilactobacillus enshiensis]
MKTGGTGGANTNHNGLTFEKKTDLAAHIVQDLSTKYDLRPHIFSKKVPIHSSLAVFDVIRLIDQKSIGIISKKQQFYNIMYEHYNVKNINYKQWEPDETFFNFETNTIFIVEKKWQNHTGSTDEKIFGFGNKRRLYQNNFNQLQLEPKPTVSFAALFNSSWWLYGLKTKPTGNLTSLPQKNYQDYFDALRMDGIKIFFDDYDYWWFGL